MATYFVTTIDDENDLNATVAAPGGDGLSLREAVGLANANQGADQIEFAAGLSGVIRLTQGEIAITGSTSIYGDQRITITGDANDDDFTLPGDITQVYDNAFNRLDDNSRIFNISAAATLDGLTLTGGRGQESGVRQNPGESGGAVFSSGDLTIANSIVSGNSTAGIIASGGGVYVTGNLVISNSVFSGNSTAKYFSNGGGVAAAGDLTITNSTFFGNSTDGFLSYGGGAFARGTLNITTSTISGNYTKGSIGLGAGAFAIGDLIVENSIVLGNVTESGSYNELALEPFNRPITFIGNNIVGADFSDFDPYTGIGGSGSVQNANPEQVFAATTDNNGAIAGVLAYNGGNIPTIALSGNAENPALDAATITGLDARGEARSVDLNFINNGGASDLGAFELQGQFLFDPTATGDAALSAAENQTFAGAAASSDGQPDLAFSVTGGADGSRFSINRFTGVLIFKGPPDFEAPVDADGDNVYQVQVTTDANGALSVQSLDISVTNVNEAPVAFDAIFSGDEDTVISGLLDASDLDSENLTFKIISNPQNGSVVIDPDGSFTYTPDANFNRTDRFFFQVFDGILVDNGSIEIPINPVNDAPIARDRTIKLQEGGSIKGNVSADDIDTDSFDLVYGLAENGDAANGVAGFGSDGSFFYRPNPDFSGIDSFTFTVFDGTSTDTGVVTVTVVPSNAAPDQAAGDEDTILSGPLFASGIDRETLTFSLLTDTARGDVAVGANGFFTYTPDANFTGTDRFTYRVSDGSFTENAVIKITVLPVNDAPVASVGKATGDEDTVIFGTLAATDIDGDALTFALAVDGGTMNGSVVVGANGSFTYTPNADFNGTDNFIFEASDGTFRDTAMVTLTVSPVVEPSSQDADTLIGTALNDTIRTMDGDDIVAGFKGDDILIGGRGNDSIKGGLGDDRLRGNQGEDTVKGGNGEDNLKGNGGKDVMFGNTGDDVMRAGGGADNVKGGGGADLIFGGGGADQLNGGGGADTIRGDGGDDTLKGNGGADVFQFRASDLNDTISDFRQGQDKIQIQSGADNFAGLDIQQDGRDVLIGFGAGQVRVVTDNSGAFDESDFIF